LTFFPLVGVLVSIKFHAPGFLDGISTLTFGRIRPVHVNGVIFGSFSTGFIALLYYFVPRLCGVPLYKEEWGRPLLWLWNAFLILGTLSFLLGYNLGLEAAEYEWPLNLLRFAVLSAVGIQVFGTILKRRERRIYVALWYTIAALIWTWMNLLLGNVLLPYSAAFSGVNSAAMHGLYIHYIVGLWLTPAGLAIIYYFLPLSAKKPLYNHGLSLLGFWSLALFYPFVGTHHYLYSPIPHMTQTMSITTSMLLIIPVWTVTVNFFGTMMGRWGAVLGGGGGDNYAAKFLILGAVYYWFGCFQGSLEALRRLQQLTHFNDFVIGHSHLTVFGTMVLWMVGGLYYLWPRLTGRKLWSDRLASWHLWLTITGFTVMSVGLTGMGFVQGSMLEYQSNFIDTIRELRPWWVIRTITGVTMDIGLLLFVINLYRTARRGDPFEEPAAEPPLWAKKDPAEEGMQEADTFAGTRPSGKVGTDQLFRPTHRRHRWFERPGIIFLVAGVGFFFAAVAIQGIVPWLMPGTRTATVQDAVTGKPVQVADYTPLELRGREIYIREGCWYCHSQYIRPVTGESFRWGPVSQAGEYAYDRPHLFSTRRIGPDLTRIGRKYGDDWHIAHHWNPRGVVPDSIMPAFPWLFEPAEEGKTPKLNEDGRALIAYLQRMGTGIGDWMEVFTPTRLIAGGIPNTDPRLHPEWTALGKTVYERRCIGCHGADGDGEGEAAPFLDPKPRDFRSGIFKFRSTPGKDSLPTDGDLFETITHGLWGTAMPAWHDIPDRERIAVISYLKTFSPRWREETPGRSFAIPSEPPVTAESIANGDAIFHGNGTCFICHGNEGKGNGLLAGTLTDYKGRPVKPADFTLPAGMAGGVKLGHGGEHLFKTITAGVGGTPMPPFRESLSPAEIWDVVHYVQSLRVSAYMQELVSTGLKEEHREEAEERIWTAISSSPPRRGEAPDQT
jgi:cytochrome c oxidase cbb3-type subunit 1